MRPPVLKTLFVAITWCFVLEAGFSSAASACSNSNVVSTQRDLSAGQLSDTLCACFADRDELLGAMSEFLKDGCSDDNNCNNDVVKKYGWPIGSWCVSNVTDMGSIFIDFLYFA